MKSIILAALLTAILLLSCATRPVTIPEGLTPMEIIQRAQEASDRYRYSAALQYYETLIERFPFDIDNVIAAEYEIAFIHFKQKRYDIARTGFNNILERYNHPDAALLPPQFRILSRRILENMDEIEAQGRSRWNRA
jgi:outer membrane protein assembly factor BamD (BamD/ComL family)